MLTDADQTVRVKAVDVILNLRGTQELGDDKPRKFIIPELKFDAASYAEIIDWKKEALYEPAVTTSLTALELRDLMLVSLMLTRYSAHTLSVERLVKQTSKAAAHVAGYAARDGFLRASAKSREIMPKFGSKQDYQNIFL